MEETGTYISYNVLKRTMLQIWCNHRKEMISCTRNEVKPHREKKYISITLRILLDLSNFLLYPNLILFLAIPRHWQFPIYIILFQFLREIKTYVHIKACIWISLQPQKTQNGQNLIVCQGISLSSKMELTIDSCNMDGYQKCEAEQKKQDTQEHTHKIQFMWNFGKDKSSPWW